MLTSIFILFFTFTVVLFFAAFLYKKDNDLQILIAILGFFLSVIIALQSMNIEVLYIVDDTVYSKSNQDYAFFGISLIMSLMLLFQVFILVFTRVVKSASVDTDHFNLES